MTELLSALADTSTDAETRRLSRIASALYEASKLDQEWGWQKRLADKTGLSRETIRRHIEDEKIRRRIIKPTKRYLAEQERVAKRRAARES